MVGDPRPRLLEPGLRPIVLGVVGLMTVIAVATVASSTVMPIIARDLGGLDDYVWGFSAAGIMSLLGIVLGGLICDAYGPRRGLFAGVSTLSLASILVAVSPTFTWFVVARVGQGLGGGILMVTTYVVIARAIPDQLRPQAMAALAAAWVVPTFSGAVVAGLVTDHLSWRAIFAAVPVVSLVACLVIAPHLRSLVGTGALVGARGRLAGAAVAVFGLLVTQDGMSRASAAGFVEAAAGVTLVWLACRSLLPSGALAFHRGLPASVMMRGVISAGYFASAAFIPLALIELRGATATEAGLIMGVAGFAWWLGSYLQGRLSTPDNATRLVAIGSGVVACSLLLMPVLVLPDLPIWTAAVLLGVCEIGLGLSLPAVSVQVFRLSQQDRQGFNSSALQIMDTVLSAILAALLSLIYANAVREGGPGPGTFTFVWVIASVPAILGVLVAHRMRPA
jgi:MFS family permease